MHYQTQAWHAALTSENHVPHLHFYLLPSLPLDLLEAVQVPFSEPYIDLTVYNASADNSKVKSASRKELVPGESRQQAATHVP